MRLVVRRGLAPGAGDERGHDRRVDATGEAAARRVDLQQRYDFTARNFEEIQRTIRYACETPVALDARLGAWARALQDASH